MAKMNPWLIGVLVVVAALVVMNYGGFSLGGGETTDSGIGKEDIGRFVDADIKLYAKDKYVPSTSITAADENATVIEDGQTTTGVLLNGGTAYDLVPGQSIEILFGADDEAVADDYYAALVKYTGEATDTTQKVRGDMCQIDTTPGVTVYDENGQVQSASANAQSVAAEGVENVEIKVEAGANECYGNPDASSDNVICFEYNDTVFADIEPQGLSKTGQPGTIVASAAANQVDCFKLPKLEDFDDNRFKVRLEATSTEPTIAHNITVHFDDIALYIDADSNSVEEGFQDEDNNALGATAATSTIYIS